MPVLKTGERTQRCLCDFHSTHRSQKYYVVRKYFNELENMVCPGCLHVFLKMGYLKYNIDDGYTPISAMANESVLKHIGYRR